jgi:hypothetical protein
VIKTADDLRNRSRTTQIAVVSLLHLIGFGKGAPPGAVGAGAAGPSKERVVEQVLPRSQPTWIPGSSEQPVGVGDDCGAVSPQVC